MINDVEILASGEKTSFTPILGAIIIVLIIALIWHKIQHGNLFKKRVTKVASKDKAQGIIYGKQGFRYAYSPPEEESHTAVFGGTGSGKSSALLIPTLNSWGNTNNTFFAIDISGDLHRNVNCKNKLVFEPLNQQSIPYNIFDMVDHAESTDKKCQILENLSYLILPDIPTENSTSQYFTNGARDMLCGALVAYYFKGFDYVDICNKIVSQTWRDLLNDIASFENEKANNYIRQFQGNNDSNNAGCKQSLDRAVKLFVTDSTLSCTFRRPNENELFLAPRMLEKFNTFLVIPDEVLDMYSVCMRIVTAQCLNYFSARSLSARTTILFALDEYSSLGNINIVDALAKYRKRKVRIMILTQSLADIDRIYGTITRNVMMNNFNVKIVLNCSDEESQQWFSRIIGMETKIKNSVSKSGDNVTRTESENREFSVQPEYFGKLRKTLILVHDGYGYIELKKNYYFTKKTLFEQAIDRIISVCYNVLINKQRG